MALGQQPGRTFIGSDRVFRTWRCPSIALVPGIRNCRISGLPSFAYQGQSTSQHGLGWHSTKRGLGRSYSSERRARLHGDSMAVICLAHSTITCCSNRTQRIDEN